MGRAASGSKKGAGFMARPFDRIARESIALLPASGPASLRSGARCPEGWTDPSTSQMGRDPVPIACA